MIVMDILTICGAMCVGMLYAYSIILLHETVKACHSRRRDEETRQNQNTRSGFQGFQERTNNNVEENNNNETTTS